MNLVLAPVLASRQDIPLPFRRRLLAAEKFLFDQQSVMDLSVAVFDEAEQEMLRLGLLPPPARPCWYELRTPVLESTSSMGLLVDRSPEGRWLIVEVGRSWTHKDTLVIEPIEFDEKHLFDGGTFSGLACSNHVPWEQAVCATTFTLFCTLSLLSKSTEIEEPTPAPRRSYTDIRKGIYKGLEFRTVHITPRHLRSEQSGGTHASPRLHWRRSHLRWVSGRPVVVVRHLVGRAELGRVEHDHYEVKVG